MDFIAGFIIGTILMMAINTFKLANKGINSNIDTQPEFTSLSRPIATQKELDDAHETLGSSIRINLRLYKELDYWKREAIKNAAKLGEQKIRLEELKEGYKK